MKYSILLRLLRQGASNPKARGKLVRFKKGDTENWKSGFVRCWEMYKGPIGHDNYIGLIWEDELIKD